MYKNAMARHRVTGAIVALVAGLLVAPSVASAGAPNYDCVAGTSARIAIDQYSDIVAANGLAGSVVWGTASRVRQEGPSLDLVATLRGVAWKVAIRGGGKSLVLTSRSGSLKGNCIFIPGNFALRSSDSGGKALRARPSAKARRVMPIAVGTAVWQRPGVPQGDWLQVIRFVERGGSLSGVAGWLRQRKPSVARFP